MRIRPPSIEISAYSLGVHRWKVDPTDTLTGSAIGNLKELRPRSGRDVAIRLLFVFDPLSQAVLLVAGNKAGDWSGWYKTAIPMAETAYDNWLAYERKRREGS